MWFITPGRQTRSERGALNNNSSSVLWEETLQEYDLPPIKLPAVWADLSFQPLFYYITSPWGQHLNRCVWKLYSASMELECQLRFITSPFYIQHVNASACVCQTCFTTHSLPTVRWDPSNSPQRWNNSSRQGRQMKTDGGWELTPWPPVIRYGRCNWPAVFSINRHYGPLCWPAPLAALLFLEAPGSSSARFLHPSGLLRFISIIPYQQRLTQQV